MILRPSIRCARRCQSGVASVLVLVLLAILGVLLYVNASSTQRAFRETRLVDERQQRHHPWLRTNTPPAAAPAPASSKPRTP